jgi:hypothetical protein
MADMNPRMVNKLEITNVKQDFRNDELESTNGAQEFKNVEQDFRSGEQECRHVEQAFKNDEKEFTNCACILLGCYSAGMLFCHLFDLLFGL